jgi:hypothetical protein
VCHMFSPPLPPGPRRFETFRNKKKFTVRGC